MHTDHQPIPHTRIRPRGLFIDRWGTLLELPEGGHCAHERDLRFLPGALDALFRAARMGWRIYLIGNEDQVAFGKQSDSAWRALEQAIVERLESHGVPVARSYSCLEHPAGKGAHARPSVFRLPDTGVFFHAEHEDGVDLERSWVIGDSSVELVAGERARLRSIGVRTGLALRDEAFAAEPVLVAADLPSAVAALSRAGAEAA